MFNLNEMTSEQLFGLTNDHIADRGLCSEALRDFERMRMAASNEGLDLCIASGFRSFEQQQAIWNAKCSGQRPVLDDDQRAVDLTALSTLDRVLAIMRFSALPGFSRHHWGTDFDYFDKVALPENYQLQLISTEYVNSDSIFKNAHEWLQENAISFGFGFPYAIDQGGVAAEPWHLSHVRSVAKFESALASISEEQVKQLYSKHSVCENETIIANFANLKERFMTRSFLEG